MNVNDLALRLSDHITAMLAYWDKDLLCRYANNAYIEWFGKTKDNMINTIRIDQLLGPLYEKNLPYIKGVLKGQRQLFEREIPLPDGSGIRHSLATYIPDFNEGEVAGFFVHVADVTYLKQLEHEIVSAKRETLRKIIETEETEKRNLVEILRESVNQRLVACKLLAESERKKDFNNPLHQEMSESISGVIHELNQLCRDLAPTEIEMLGLVETLGQFLAEAAKRHGKSIEYTLNDHHIEKILLKDKYSIFRIVQNFISLAFDQAGIQHIDVSVQYLDPLVKIKFRTDREIEMNKRSKEYHALASRVDNFSGKLTVRNNELEIEFALEYPASSRL